MTEQDADTTQSDGADDPATAEAQDDSTAEESVAAEPNDDTSAEGEPTDETQSDGGSPGGVASERDASDGSGVAPDQSDTQAGEALEEGIDLKIDVDEDIQSYVESTEPAELADEISTLRFEVEALEDDIEEYEQQVEDLKSKLKRKQADFENYKKRMKRRREEERERATEDLVERLLDVRDNLQRAVDQGEDADIRDGVESTLRQFDRVLEEENVTAIEPQPGDEVDPARHEVLVRMDSDQPADTIAEVHRPGYEMAEKVIRPAQVAVSDGDDA